MDADGRTPQQPSKEKRRNVRTDIVKGVRVSWQGGSEHKLAHISNLSLNGLFVETPEPLEIGTITNLSWEASGKEILARAIVRRTVPGRGMGVEFMEMGAEDSARLQNLLRTTRGRELSNQGQNVEHRLRENKPDAPPARPIHPAEVAQNSKTLPTILPRAQSSQRRAHSRHKIAALVEIVEVESGKRIKAHLDNLGRAGCYVKTENASPVGRSLSVLITKGQHSFRAQARVVYAISGKGMGLMFTAVEPKELRTLDTWFGVSEEAAWLESNRRRSQRIVLAVPVQIVGHNSQGGQFEEVTQTICISTHGALVHLSTPVNKGQHLILLNLQTKGEAECTVVYIARLRKNMHEVGVSFAMPNQAFWRAVFPPANWSPHHPDAKGT